MSESHPVSLSLHPRRIYSLPASRSTRGSAGNEQLSQHRECSQSDYILLPLSLSRRLRHASGMGKEVDLDGRRTSREHPPLDVEA